MIFFLAYDNSYPLFVGGKNHGKKCHVQKEYRRFLRPVYAEPVFRFSRDLGFESAGCETEEYREEWFMADDRRFRIFIHVSLPVHAALMLMLSMTGEHPDLVKRIKELEDENRALKKMLHYMAAHP